MADVKLDAVIVATPPATHPEIACFFMERGTPVLCEKPLCVSVAEAEKMIAAAEKMGVLFTMASKFRYCDDVIKAKGILTSGVLGDVLQFENAFTAKVDMNECDKAPSPPPETWAIVAEHLPSALMSVVCDRSRPA